MWSAADGPARAPVEGEPHPRDLLMIGVPQLRRWHQTAWLLLGVAGGAVAVWLVHAVVDGRALRGQVAAYRAARDDAETQRQALAHELATTRGLLAVATARPTAPPAT